MTKKQAEALWKFTEEVKNLAYAVSLVSGTDQLAATVTAAEELKRQLVKDFNITST